LENSRRLWTCATFLINVRHADPAAETGRSVRDPCAWKSASARLAAQIFKTARCYGDDLRSESEQVSAAERQQTTRMALEEKVWPAIGIA
jgi:hypothetical protein